MQDLDGRRRVREGAKHPGDVAERGSLPPALVERSRRLALEVDHPPVAVRPERLPEVEVAVVADHTPDGADMREHPQLLTDILAAAHDRCDRLVVFRQLEEDALDLLVDRRRQEAERLGARLLGAERGIRRV